MEARIPRRLCILLAFLCAPEWALSQSSTPDRRAAAAGDTLPLSFSYQEYVLEDIRRFGIGINLMYYSPDFGQLSIAHGEAAGPKTSLHMGMAAKIKIAYGIHLHASAGLGLGGDMEYRTVMGLVLYQMFPESRLRPMLGMGWGHGSFYYDANMVITKGGKGGFVILGGGEFVTSKKTGIEVCGGYWFVPGLSTVFSQRISVELKRPFFCVRLIGYL